MHARIGMPVSSSDGPWGELDDFIVDRTNWHITHLVVQPHHHHDRSHLVPISEVKSSRSRLTLALSADDIESSPQFEITEFVKIDRPQSFGNRWTTDASSVSAWPYYPSTGPPLDPAAAAFTYSHGTAYLPRPKYLATTFDHVPDHEVRIRRSSHVISSDEHTIGTVDGFVFDGDGRARWCLTGPLDTRPGSSLHAGRPGKRGAAPWLRGEGRSTAQLLRTRFDVAQTISP